MTLEGYFGDLLNVVTLRAQLQTRDMLVIAKFLVSSVATSICRTEHDLQTARTVTSDTEELKEL